eukprot:615270-Prorocentrum_minimum.AAC.1
MPRVNYAPKSLIEDGYNSLVIRDSAGALSKGSGGIWVIFPGITAILFTHNNTTLAHRMFAAFPDVAAGNTQ